MLWYGWNNIDLPEWMTEEQGKGVCSFLNAYIPRKYSTRGTRYHLLNRYHSGRLYFHLLHAPESVAPENKKLHWNAAAECKTEL